MNNTELTSADFTHSLPPPLKNDPNMLAIARAVAEQLRQTAQQIRKNVIYARIDELDEQTLDVLAYDLHVDWYDYSYPVEVKRQTIKDSVKIHRKLGTKYAVETALGAVFPGTTVKEWFEYGGDPFMFKVIIGATDSGVSADKQAAVLERVRFYKNIRSHLEAISYQIEKRATVAVGAVHSVGVRLEVYPYLAEDIDAEAHVQVAAVHTVGVRVDIYPHVYRKMESKWRVVCAGYIQQTGRLEIFPDSNGTEA